MVIMNKKMRALAAGIALTLSLGLLAGCGGEKKAADNSKKVVNVGIVQLVEHDALDAANKGFIAGMAAKGFKENENVKYDRQNAQADQSNLQNIAQRFVSNKVDLICAIATPAAQTMANDQGSKASVLPMGSLFEGALFVLFEVMVLKLMALKSITYSDMRARHTNLE